MISMLRGIALGISGIDDADWRRIHRRAAIDHVADPAGAGIAVGETEPDQQPLLRVKKAIDEHHFAAVFGHVARFVGNQRHDSLGKLKDAEMIAGFEIEPAQELNHVGIVGVAAVSLAEIGRTVPRLNEIGDLAVALLDFLRIASFGGRSERVSDCPTVEAAAYLLLKQAHSCFSHLYSS